MKARTTQRRLVAFFGVGALTMSLWSLPSAATPDVPGADDVEHAEQAAQTQAGRIAVLEVELAENSAALDEANIAAATAAEEYNIASVKRDEARAGVTEANKAAEKAQLEVDEASLEVARIATAAYRNGGAIQRASMFLSAEGVEDVIDNANTFRTLGKDADQAYQRLDAAEVVSDVMTKRAEEALSQAESAAEDLKEASDQAKAAALNVENLVSQSETRRTEMINELAALNNTTAALEAERQAALEEERRARRNAAAAEAVGAPAANPEPEAAPQPTSNAETSNAEKPESQEAQDRASQVVRDNDRNSSGSSSNSGSVGSGDSNSSGSRAPSSSGSSSGGSNSGGSSSGGSSSSGASPSGGSSSGGSSSGGSKSGSSSSGGSSSGGSPSGGSSSGGSSSSSSAGQKAVNAAMTQVGDTYVLGANGPDQWDCSSLTRWAWAQAGKSLPRVSRDQYGAVTKVPLSKLRPGDLIFSSRNGAQSGIYHVAIYAGNGMRVHAANPAKGVEYTSVWWENVLPMAGRP